MTTIVRPVSTLSAGLERLEVLLDEFRQALDAGAAAHERLAASNSAGPDSRISRYKVRAATLPQLGEDAAPLNSQLRANLYLGATRPNSERRGRTPRRQAHRRSAPANATNALDLQLTASAKDR
jgi:hypothetical protein